MESNASLSVVLKGWREGVRLAKSIYQPFVGTVGRFPLVSPRQLARCVSSSVFFFSSSGAKISPTRAMHANSIPCRSTSPRVYRVLRQSGERSSDVCSGMQERDFDDRRAYSSSTQYICIYV